MKAALLTVCLWAVALAKPRGVEQFELDPPTHVGPVRLRYDPYHVTWAEFKRNHGKLYETDEEEKARMKIFIDKVKHIELHNWEYVNKKTPYYKDINQFSDMTPEEYRQYNRLHARKASPSFQCTPFQPPLNWHTPAEVDWRKEGYVTPVKNQGSCGSCWAFSTTGSVEGQHFRLTGKLVSLSEQQLVDCSGKFGNEGCQGGLMDQAFKYIDTIGGLETEDEYPYVAEGKACKFNISEVVPVTNVTACQDIPSGSESDLMQAVASQGPVSVAIDASYDSFQDYAGGVYDEPGCSNDVLDHGVLAVGYGSLQGVDYWIVKNSWGTTWGMDGYILMSRNKGNQCGIATAASFPQLTKN